MEAPRVDETFALSDFHNWLCGRIASLKAAEAEQEREWEESRRWAGHGQPWFPPVVDKR